MKKLSLNIALTISGLLNFSISGAEELRDWTNTAGKTISAEMVSLSGNDITLKMENGRTYTLPLDSLSAEDQTFAKTALAEKEAIASAPKPKTETLMTLPGKLLYETDFKEMPEGWSGNVGDWSASESGLTGTERAADDHAAVMKKAMSLKDVIIEYDILLGTTKSAMFGIDNNDHMCRVTLTRNSFQARKDDNDHEGPDMSKLFNSVSEEFKGDEWHTVRIELLGEEMLAQTGDHISLGSDPLLAQEKTKWGFVVSGDTVGFRNLAIWEALPNEAWEKTGARLKRKLEVED